MFIAMNRFKISKNFCHDFERIWRERDSYLEKVGGFRSFNLFKSAEYEDFVLYASHSVWEDEKAFRAWTESEEFRSAHRQAKAPKGTYASHPELETFTSIL
jgi:heme-degrading monooxygenase HmoA